METVVEFLEEKLQGHLDISRRYWNELLVQAKEMFEKQINEAYNQGQMDGFGLEEKDDYFSETFKSE
jgi:hypothetical protein